MSPKIKIAFTLGISLYFLLALIHVTDAQNLKDLSYGPEVLPIPSATTQVPITSTTKKSSFFGGIKKWFKSDATTEQPSSTTAAPVVGSITPSTTKPGSTVPATPSRDYVNPNVGKPGVVPGNTPQGAPVLPGSTPTTPTQSPTRRDFVNPNINPGIPSNNQPQSPNRDFVNPGLGPGSPPTGQTQGVIGQSPPATPSSNRDYVNPNIKPGSTPTPSPQGISTPAPTNAPTPQSPQGSPTPPPRRDYVNPNIRPGSPPQPQNPANPSSPLPANQNTGPGSPTQPPRRDYVNPNIGPGSAPSSPTTGQSAWNLPSNTPNTGSPTQQPSRDYVNPNLPSAPTKQPGGAQPIPTNEDFPPLPPPRRQRPTQPRPGSPRQPTPQSGGSSTPNANEIASDEEITALTETLYSKETTNNPNRYVTINYQGKTRSSDTTDEAAAPLLQVQEDGLRSPTIEKMRPLFNNYELDTTVNEYVTPIERKEENEFIDAVLTTPVMRQAMTFLQNKGIVTPDPRTHRELLKTIWFTLYSRGGGRIGSSAFEHIFLSEIKNGTVTGLHNWVYYFEEESKGHIDYKGYIKKVELGDKGAIVKYRFDFNGIPKPVNAMFVGTSPELEMALYTVCFQVRPDKDCPISLNGTKFNLKTYTFRYRGKNLIGSAFPEI